MPNLRSFHRFLFARAQRLTSAPESATTIADHALVGGCNFVSGVLLVCALGLEAYAYDGLLYALAPLWRETGIVAAWCLAWSATIGFLLLRAQRVNKVQA